MAIEKKDLNTLNNIQITATNNRTFLQDVRSLIFFTNEFLINPTFIQTPQDVLDLGVVGLDETHAFYQLIRSAFTQDLTPLNVIVYGETISTTFTKFIGTYKDNANAFEVTNWITNIDYTTNKSFIESIIAYSKTDKTIQVSISLERSKFSNVQNLIDIQTNSNASGVCFVVEGTNNIQIGNWLNGAFFGGTVGVKNLGAWTGHSTEIKGFVQENYTSTEQKSMWDAGLNYLSKPTKGYFHLVNGRNSDNKTYIELNLTRIWTLDKLQKEITITQIVMDKLPLFGAGQNILFGIITEICRQGADAGMFLTDANGDYFGTITQTDSNGNNLRISLGYLEVGTITQDDLREGRLSFDLRLTFQDGVRFVNLTGQITTDGELII